MDDLRKIVDAATPGPWSGRIDESGPTLSPAWSPSWIVADVLDGGALDLTYLATFDPVLVSALLDVAEAARAQVESIPTVFHDEKDEAVLAALDRLEEVRRDR